VGAAFKRGLAESPGKRPRIDRGRATVSMFTLDSSFSSHHTQSLTSLDDSTYARFPPPRSFPRRRRGFSPQPRPARGGVLSITGAKPQSNFPLVPSPEFPHSLSLQSLFGVSFDFTRSYPPLFPSVSFSISRPNPRSTFQFTPVPKTFRFFARSREPFLDIKKNKEAWFTRIPTTPTSVGRSFSRNAVFPPRRVALSFLRSSLSR